MEASEEEEEEEKDRDGEERDAQRSSRNDAGLATAE